MAITVLCVRPGLPTEVRLEIYTHLLTAATSTSHQEPGAEALQLSYLCGEAHSFE